ncbi:HEAT repeat domain-containing protein [Streptomyces sp. NPDC059720]|uniref:HEAT repeat domain-containing protein n=1 Tax=Streptomyces sp. NPDC059720 TaxID=3346924 RepID=UPI0036A92D4D
MFSGIDEVDWASLRYADGSAQDLPGLLRALASADPAERGSALDGMYGAVHHRGDVHDAALACVPFLLSLAVREEVPDRAGVVELLVSIGDPCGDGGELAARARAALRARAEVFVRLAADTDSGVRRVVPGALVRFLDGPARVLALLGERILVERDDRVLTALAEALGLFVRRYGHAAPARPSRRRRFRRGVDHGAEAVRLLEALSGPPYGPALRLAALGQLAGCAPERLPSDLVPVAVQLLRERSGRRAATGCACGGPGPETLAGRLRRLRPSDEEGSRLLRTLHAGLGSRVADRAELLCGQLTSPDPLDRCNGVWMAAGFVREWRDGHERPVVLIGAQLGSAEDRLHDAAVTVLAELHALAAPAADRLHALVTSRPEYRTRHGERGTPALGGALKALAAAGDARAVPVLAEVLAGPVVPHELGRVVPHLGRAAAPLAPALRRRLARVPLDGACVHEQAVPLLSALGALGDVPSLPSVLRLLRGMPQRTRGRDAVMDAALRALGAFGGGAREAIPDLRALLGGSAAVAAAEALWQVSGDADAVVPTLLREAAGPGRDRRRRAAAVLARVGSAARPALPVLRRMAGSGDPADRAAAACAVWRTTGEPDEVLPVLRALWTGHPHTRPEIAGCAAALGPGGAPLHDLLRAELTSPRRHRADLAGSRALHEDLVLLRLCGQALEGGG